MYTNTAYGVYGGGFYRAACRRFHHSDGSVYVLANAKVFCALQLFTSELPLRWVPLQRVCGLILAYFYFLVIRWLLMVVIFYRHTAGGRGVYAIADVYV